MIIENTESSKRTAMEKYGFGEDAMKKIKVCPSCKSAQSAQDKNCAYCGARLPEQTLFDLYSQRHVVCKTCGEVLARRTKFCPQCGKRVN